MPKRSAIVTVYVAGLAQGLALITFPAASAVLMAAGAYGLSPTQYGGLFVPQAILAVAAALSGGALTRRLGAKRVLILGLCADLAAMGLLVLSLPTMHEPRLAYGILLAATACMGLAFGWVVPTLNAFVARFFPGKVDGAVLALNALLGLGTVLAPVLITAFTACGWWWGLPVTVALVLLGLIVASVAVLQAGAQGPGTAAHPAGRSGIPARFWLFAACALLYGVCETMNATWASPYMAAHCGAGAGLSALALTVFWAMVTGGRLLLAALERWVTGALALRILPMLVAGAFVATATLTARAPVVGLLTFALAGLGCSGLLPLIISRGQTEMTGIPTAVAGGIIAAYQIGYGIAAFGVGPLQALAQADMSALYGGAAAVAGAMAVLTFAITRPGDEKQTSAAPARA